MLISAIETIRLSHGITVHAGPIRWLWVRVHTDAGLVGLGETYPHPEAEAAIIREALAPIKRVSGSRCQVPARAVCCNLGADTSFDENHRD